jgi:hypothetical protein
MYLSGLFQEEYLKFVFERSLQLEYVVLLADGHYLVTTLNLIASPKLLPFLWTIKAQSRH